MFSVSSDNCTLGEVEKLYKCLILTYLQLMYTQMCTGNGRYGQKGGGQKALLA